MKIFGVTGGGRILDGASVHRIAQYQDFLSFHDIKLDVFYSEINKLSYYNPQTGIKTIDSLTGKLYDRLKFLDRMGLLFKKRKYDTFWISRSVINYPNLFDNYFGNYIYDIDDAVWLADAKGSFDKYCRNAKVIFAGNDFLARYAEAYNKNVHIVPTAVDTTLFKRENRDQGRFRIGFFGTSGGYKFIKPLQGELARFLKEYDAEFCVMGDRYPEELDTLKGRISYIPWKPERSNGFLNSLSVGIMPLFDTEWERGKCSYKMLLYMACGIPVIVSAVGMNKEVLKLQEGYGNFGRGIDQGEEWYDALRYYYNMDKKEREEQGANAVSVIQDHFSKEKIGNKILSVIKREYL
ncbi:MAG: glycosyltransferase [Niabella sp.]